MKYVITGGSGFLGSRISELLIQQGHEVVSLDIKEPKVRGVKFVAVNLLKEVPENPLLKNPDVCINLAGKLIFGRWTKQFKQLVRDTRVIGTKNLISFFEKEEYRPKVLVQASAVGVYGDRGDEDLSEGSGYGEGFLSSLAAEWEEAARSAENLGIRVVIIRNGHILGKGGIVRVLEPCYRKGIGGPLGNGNQYMPWIHLEDISKLYIKLSQEEFSGVVNGVAPQVIRNKYFSNAFAEALQKPHFLFIPKLALKILYGDFAEEMVGSQKVSSTRIPEDFDFQFKTVEEAFSNILL